MLVNNIKRGQYTNVCGIYKLYFDNDSRFYMEQNSPDCKHKVPHEGIVIKKEGSWSSAFKLKCWAFLNKEAKELDNGETNIEDNQ